MLCRHSVVTILAALSSLAAGLSSGMQPTTPSPAADVQPSTKNAAAEPTPRTDEWWTKRNETFNARARQGAEKGDVGVVFLGDSITQGWEQNGQQVWKDRYTSRNAVNFGIGGDRTQHLLWRIQNGNLDALSSPKAGTAPKLAIILIGTNNCNGTDHTAAEVAQGVSAIVAAVRQELPATKILLMGIFPRGERPNPIREKIAEINTKIAALHDGSAVFYKDISSVFLADDGSISKDIMPDALHLSARGYQLWADAIEPDVRDLLGGS
jgi:lysophospholipase L1-like esterase